MGASVRMSPSIPAARSCEVESMALFGFDFPEASLFIFRDEFPIMRQKYFGAITEPKRDPSGIGRFGQ